MFSIEKVIGKLAGLNTAAGFAAVVPELADELARADLAIDDLKGRLEAALFDSPREVSAIQAEIAAVEAQKGALRLALAGAQRRQEEAAAVEREAEIVAASKGAKKVQERLREQYIKLHEHFFAATELLGEIRKGEDEIRACKDLCLKSGRKDLLVQSPWYHLGQLIGDSAHTEEFPLTGVLIRGYFPAQSARGPALSRMRSVKL